MKFSWQWLNKLIDLQNKPLEEIIDKLTLAGFEIDDIENLKDIKDTILNISITANRSDTMSMIGLARELSTILNIKLLHQSHNQDSIKRLRLQKQPSLQFIPNSISDIELTFIQNIKPISSPQWLKNYLIGCGIIPTNTLCDIAQYINIKWGQDIEIFDTQKIDNNKFDINFINITEISHTSQYTKHKHVKLEGLTYKNKTIALLGLATEPNLSCETNTSSIIVLGHICKPVYLKKTVTKLKYKTEKSNKHVKSISRNDFSQAYEETINLIFQLTNHNTKHKYITYYKWHKPANKPHIISVPKQKVYDILGPLNNKKEYLTNQNIIKILEQLNFQPKYHNDHFFVTIPEYRNTDIQRVIDVIEEIGRIYGFNNFTSKIINNNIRGRNSNINIFINKIGAILRNSGLHEVLHYSLEKQDYNESTIQLYNPLLEDQTNLRTNLVYNLLNTLIYNNNQTNTYIECFEIGKVFEIDLSSNNHLQYNENIHVAGILGKDEVCKTSWSEQGKTLSWFQAKGLLETLFEHLHANIIWSKSNNFNIPQEYNNLVNLCHLHRFAILKNQYTDEIVGIFSELNIKYTKQLTTKHRTYIFELNLLNLIKASKPAKHLHYIWQQYSNYPSVTRDISLISDKNITARFTKQKILSSHPLIESVEIFNEYYIENHLRSTSFRITYRSHKRTLNDHDIQTIDNNINSLLKQLSQ